MKNIALGKLVKFKIFQKRLKTGGLLSILPKKHESLFQIPVLCVTLTQLYHSVYKNLFEQKYIASTLISVPLRPD